MFGVEYLPLSADPAEEEGRIGMGSFLEVTVELRGKDELWPSGLTVYDFQMKQKRVLKIHLKISVRPDVKPGVPIVELLQVQ